MVLDHLAIVSQNIKRDVKWYKEAFDCRVGYQDKTWALLEFDNISLSLVTKDEHPNHFAIVNSKVINDKKAKKHRDGIYYIYKKDPSGNVIEIIDKSSN